MSYSGDVLLLTPEAYWRLGEGAAPASIVDSSGNARHATPDPSPAAGPTFGVPALISSDPNTAASLDGLNDFIRCGYRHNYTAGITYIGWIKTPGSTLPLFPQNLFADFRIGAHAGCEIRINGAQDIEF